jgi:hypothetical protein
MKRIAVFGILLVFVVSAAFAQLGSAPTGYESYASDEMMLALYYPGSWFVVEEEGNLGIVNRQELAGELNKDMPDVRPGDVVMAVGFIPTFFLGMMGVPVDSIDSMVDGMFQSMMESNENGAENEREVLTYGGTQVGTVSFTDPAEDMSGIFMIAQSQDEVVVFAMAAGMREDLATNRDTLARVVSSVEFTGSLEELMGNM